LKFHEQPNNPLKPSFRLCLLRCRRTKQQIFRCSLHLNFDLLIMLSDKQLSITQELSGLAFSTYLMLHVLNTTAGLGGGAAYDNL
jgi:hypothetical protein